MQIDKYLEDKTNLYQALLEFIDNGNEEEYQKFTNELTSKRYNENRHEFNIIIRLVSKICNNYHRLPDFFTRIEKILLFLKEEIKQTYSNSEILNLFKSSKRIN